MSTTVMVVDDSQWMRHQVCRALVDAGYAVVEASDGQEALDKLAEHPSVALVVCDVNMPRMNGLDFLERTRGPTAVPVLMLTTEGQAQLVQRAKALGAKGWITKPFKPELLIATAKRLAPQE